MQIKIFNIAIPGGEAINEDLNSLLRSKKILQVESKVVTGDSGAYWCFCVRYLDEPPAPEGGAKQKVDYRTILSADVFARFSKYREIRKAISIEEGIPAYAVFTDEELAEMSKSEPLLLTELSKIKGIGEKKAEKYGPRFINPSAQKNEKSQ